MNAYAVLAIFATRTLAQTPWGGGTAIGNPFPAMGNNESDELFEYAITHPNSTRSMKFKPMAGYNTEPERDIEWTWRVNVTDFALPGLEGRYDNITNPHMVATSYDFQWPGGGNVSEALGGSTAPYCVTGLLSDVIFPPNVSNLYTQENTDSTSCLPVLGRDCMEAIRLKGLKGNSNRECRATGTIWNLLPECASTMGYTAQAHLGRFPMTFGLTQTNINPNMTANATSRANGTTEDRKPRLSGDGFWGFYGPLIDGSNATEAYVNATTHLQIILVSYTLENAESQNADVNRAELHCMRVDASEISQGDEEAETSQGDDESAATSPTRVGWAMTAVAVTMCVLMMYI